MAKESKNKNPLVSLLGGIVMTILLVVVVPVVISYFIEPIVMDLIGDNSLDLAFIQLTSGALGAIVMLIVLVLFMLLMGGGAILRKFGVIGIVGLILAYVFLLDQLWGWVVPVIIVTVLGLVSYLRDKKKGK
ncbi:MAG: hypothetical protein FWC29_05590 [Methanomassiliicoccaceae archaeon]|nr:hypothetical protein [Methanomassiliicoccaceae archaeon]